MWTRKGPFGRSACGKWPKHGARPIRGAAAAGSCPWPQNREELLAALETGVVEERARQARAALVVVDSVAAAARGGTSSGRSDLIDRQRWLARAAAALKRVACGANCAVVVTNHVMADLRARTAATP